MLSGVEHNTADDETFISHLSTVVTSTMNGLPQRSKQQASDKHILSLARYIAAHRTKHQMLASDAQMRSFATQIAEEAISTAAGQSVFLYDGYSGRNPHERATIAKVGWVISYYNDRILCDMRADRELQDSNESIPGSLANHYITHGFRRFRNHPDFEIVISIPPSASHFYFQHFYDRVVAGESFADGDEFLMNEGFVRVRLAKILFGFTPVLRLIFSDANLNFTCTSGQISHFPEYRSLLTVSQQGPCKCVRSKTACSSCQ